MIFRGIHPLLGVVIMTPLLLIYTFGVLQRSYWLLFSGNTIGVALGLALIIFPLLVFWMLGRELHLGVSVSWLRRRLSAEQADYSRGLKQLPSGRIDRRAAVAALAQYRGDRGNYGGAAAVDSAAEPDNSAQNTSSEKQTEQAAALYREGMLLGAAGERRQARRYLLQAVRVLRNKKPLPQLPSDSSRELEKDREKTGDRNSS